MTILIADDDLEDLELIEESFLKAAPDAVIHKFTNGKTAIEYLLRQPDTGLPCLIVLDYNTPELNGSEVLCEIRKHKRYDGTPKVVLSTSSTPSHMHACMTNGATEYLVKPDNINDMDALALKMLSFCGHIDHKLPGK